MWLVLIIPRGLYSGECIIYLVWINNLSGQKSIKKFWWYFGKLMISKIHSDIIWPLGVYLKDLRLLLWRPLLLLLDWGWCSLRDAASISVFHLMLVKRNEHFLNLTNFRRKLLVQCIHSPANDLSLIRLSYPVPTYLF